MYNPDKNRKRYKRLLKNKDTSRQKRIEIKKLKEALHDPSTDT